MVGSYHYGSWRTVGSEPVEVEENMMHYFLLFAFLIFTATSVIHAASVDQVRSLATQLKCPTCEAQSVADSQAPVAKEIRRVIGQRLEQNKTDKEIMSELTDKYGEHILLSPPLTPSTYLLWFLPLIGLGVILLGWLQTHIRK